MGKAKRKNVHLETVEEPSEALAVSRDDDVFEESPPDTFEAMKNRNSDDIFLEVGIQFSEAK